MAGGSAEHRQTLHGRALLGPFRGFDLKVAASGAGCCTRASAVGACAATTSCRPTSTPWPRRVRSSQESLPCALSPPPGTCAPRAPLWCSLLTCGAGACCTGQLTRDYDAFLNRVMTLPELGELGRRAQVMPEQVRAFGGRGMARASQHPAAPLRSSSCVPHVACPRCRTSFSAGGGGHALVGMRSAGVRRCSLLMT